MGDYSSIHHSTEVNPRVTEQLINSILSIRNLSSVYGGSQQVPLPSNINNNTTPKKELIDIVTCKLCKGYLVDATTLDLCMHSFCRPCAVKYIRDKPKCPECSVEIKDKRFLNRLKSDHTLQNIVYKLVPGLYEREMARRRKFYASRPSQTPRYKSEMFGDIPSSKSIKADDKIRVALTWNTQDEQPYKTFVNCRADSTMLSVRKLIIAKFGIDKPIKLYYGNYEVFFDLTTLMDVAATFNWAPENNKILNISFKEQEEGGGGGVGGGGGSNWPMKTHPPYPPCDIVNNF